VVESGRFFLALNSWVSFIAGVVVVVARVIPVVVVVVTIAAMKTGGLEKLPMSFHLLHLLKITRH
jgi:hypothetical protein